MRRLMSLLRGERRTDSRESTHRCVHVFCEGVRVGTARLLDESEGGARISLVNGAPPPEGAMLLEVETAQAHSIEVAWRRDDAVGVRYLDTQRLRGFVSPRYQPLKAFWQDAAVAREAR